jgi:hypothetical protein
VSYVTVLGWTSFIKPSAWRISMFPEKWRQPWRTFKNHHSADQRKMFGCVLTAQGPQCCSHTCTPCYPAARKSVHLLVSYKLAPASPFRRGSLQTRNSLGETIGQPCWLQNYCEAHWISFFTGCKHMLAHSKTSGLQYETINKKGHLLLNIYGGFPTGSMA